MKTLTGLFLLLIVFVSPVLAVGKPETVGGRLTEAKLRACQARENAIKKRSEHLGKLASTMEKKFTAIAQRVEEYYTTKAVPGGKTIANYDSLVSDIQTKKTAVQTALTQAQTDAGGFSCTGDNPKGQLTQFKGGMKAVIKALKDYRTSIKNLIVAVRSVTGTTERTKPSASPGPTGNQNENQYTHLTRVRNSRNLSMIPQNTIFSMQIRVFWV